MAYLITGTATFSSQANRDAAVTRVQTAISGLPLTDTATIGFLAGLVNPTTTTMTVSYTVAGDDSAAMDAAKAIYGAWVTTNRNTSGYLSVNKL
jgi:hypothetical protein